MLSGQAAMCASTQTSQSPDSPGGFRRRVRTGRYACSTLTDVKERKHVSVRAMTGRCGHAWHLGGSFGHMVGVSPGFVALVSAVC